MNKELYIDSPEAGYPKAQDLRKQNLLLERDKAVAQAQRLKGKTPLTAIEKEIAMREGYSSVPYLDDRNVVTKGFGQTGKDMDKPFSEIVSRREKEITKFFPNYKNLDENVKANLMSLYYRGDVNKNYNWVKQFNEGNYEAAAIYLLDNDEYRKRKATNKPDDVVNRLETAAATIKSLAEKKKPKKVVSYNELSGNYDPFGDTTEDDMMA